MRIQVLHNTGTRTDSPSIAILLVACAAVWAIAAIGLAATNTTIRLASLQPIGMLAAMQGALAVYCRWRNLERFTPAVETMLVLLLANIALLPISYIGVRLAYPIADPHLMMMDRLIGFDWTAFVGMVGSHWLLSAMLGVAYVSFGAQLMLLPVYFAFVRGSDRGHVMVLAYMLIVIVSSGIAIFFPSHGAFVAYDANARTIGYIDSHFGYAFLEEFNAVRTAPAFQMSLDRVQGLLTFPSVHAAVAVLCIWTAAGSRFLAIPFFILNVAMAMSAITHGGHYLIDVIAGAVVAIGSILTARLILQRSAVTADWLVRIRRGDSSLSRS